MHELIMELQNYHALKARHLSDLESCVSGLTAGEWRTESREALVLLFLPFRTSEEDAHHHNEEVILRELRKTSAPIHRRVEEISGDHEAFDRISAEISASLADTSASRGEVTSTIRRFVEIYKDHAAGEESIFFPAANQYLTERHWLSVRKAWR